MADGAGHQTQNVPQITYLRKDNSEVVRKIEPVGLLFSEYYFLHHGFYCRQGEAPDL